MFSPDDTDYNTSIGPIDRSARVASRREIINEKRQRHTDMLPKINGEMSNAKTTLARLHNCARKTNVFVGRLMNNNTSSISTGKRKHN